MKRIIIKDKEFELLIPENEIIHIVDGLAEKINNDLARSEVIFLPILNGSFIFAADIIRKINVPGTISFVKLASYKGHRNEENVKTLIGLNEEVVNRSILIIEDIVDSGSTIIQIVNDLKNRKVKDIKIVSMLLKPGIYSGDIEIDYIGKKVPDNFVVGYGLDYFGYGRNLKDIYKMIG